MLVRDHLVDRHKRHQHDDTGDHGSDDDEKHGDVAARDGFALGDAPMIAENEEKTTMASSMNAVRRLPNQI